MLNLPTVLLFLVGWSYYIVADSLNGYTAIPIRGVACSEECAILASGRITAVNETYVAKAKQERESLMRLQEESTSLETRPLKRNKHDNRFMRAARRVLGKPL